jgi:hypothetical protein
LTVSSISAKAALETFGCISGARSPFQTSSKDRKPSSAMAKSRNGTMADRTWKEMALA